MGATKYEFMVLSCHEDFIKSKEAYKNFQRKLKAI